MMIRNAALPAWQAKWIDPELPHDARPAPAFTSPAMACIPLF